MVSIFTLLYMTCSTQWWIGKLCWMKTGRPIATCWTGYARVLLLMTVQNSGLLRLPHSTVHQKSGMMWKIMAPAFQTIAPVNFCLCSYCLTPPFSKMVRRYRTVSEARTPWKATMRPSPVAGWIPGEASAAGRICEKNLSFPSQSSDVFGSMVQSLFESFLWVIHAFSWFSHCFDPNSGA